MMLPFLRITAIVTLLALGVPGARAESPMAVPVDGESFRAELTAVDAKWQLQFTSGERRRTLPAAELVQWGSYAEPAGGPIVVMADGGLLAADVTGADRESISVSSGSFGELKLPLEVLSGVVFDPPAQSGPCCRLLDRVARASGDSDRVLLHNGDEVTGLLDAIDENSVTLEVDDGPLKIELRRIAALIFNPDLKLPAEQRGFRAWAGLADGSRLIATKLVAEDRSLAVTTIGGQTWKTASAELVCLQPLGGRVTYLSDLTPAGYVHRPYLDLKWPYRIDRNATGGLLHCGGRLYLKGLGVHSTAQLTYEFDRPYRRFQAELGIDDSTGGGGSVRFRVLVDGQPKFTSETIRGGTIPVPVSVELGGAKRLDLIVDFTDRGDQQDHADWLGARLVR